MITLVTTVVVVGASGPLGRRVARRLVDTSDITVLVDPEPGGDQPGSADVVVWLAPGTASGPGPDGTGTANVVDAAPDAPFVLADEVGATHLVVLSSALVYGLRASNPVPITEDAVLRPELDAPFVTAKVEAERRVPEWRRGGADRTATVLRPTVCVAEDTADWFVPSGWAAAGVAQQGAEAPRQFLHLDDLADAVVLAVVQRLDGVHNVAPDGWLAHEELAALGGPARQVRLPGRLAERVAALRAPSPTASSGEAELALAAARSPWVIANDRLRAAGWQPAFTNAEAYVVADRGGPLAELTAAQRQAVPFAALGATFGAAVLVVWFVVRWSRRKLRAAPDPR